MIPLIVIWLRPQYMKIAKFYQEHGKEFPRLSCLAQRIALSPATNVPCECVFSHASFEVNINKLAFTKLKSKFVKIQIWDRRNRLSGEAIEEIMFLYENAIFIQLIQSFNKYLQNS